MQRTTTYREQSRLYLVQAREELAKGDIPQSSEKAWGATAQMLKAIAQERGWRHKAHRYSFEVIRRLRRETGETELTRLFSHARDLHGNFYENEYTAEELQVLLPEIERLVEQLEGMLDGG